MKILAFNQGHDLGTVYVDNGKLVFAHEAEKDGGKRHSMEFSSSLILGSFKIDGPPDVIAHAGWHKISDKYHAATDAGYFGIGPGSRVSYRDTVLGRSTNIFSVSHERSHVMCSYGMSPFPQGRPCYALVWEGSIGAFYYIDGNVDIHKIGDVLREPGNKYAFLYSLADPAMPTLSTYVRISDAGKLMALAAYGDDIGTTEEEERTIKKIMGFPDIFGTTNKASMKESKYFNIGLESQPFKNLAKKFSETMFNIFYGYAKKHLDEKLPLIVSGGCGLNCDWNNKWKECGLFPDVFVPPCTNDSGAALGAAIDAQFYYTGNAKVEWDVYSGAPFLEDNDHTDLGIFKEYPLDNTKICGLLKDNKVIAWAQGRAEIGPRALGNRSLLASPFNADMKDKLNKIKYRENFRPIAPVCIEEDMTEYFDGPDVSPYMLYFQKVRSQELRAITHVDGTARTQSVNEKQNPKLYRLLTEFRDKTGFGVLCNTSLNFPGCGFINRLSDLAEYAKERELDGFVVGNKMYLNDGAICENSYRVRRSNLNPEKFSLVDLKQIKNSLLLSLQKRGQFYLEKGRKNSDKNSVEELTEWSYKAGDNRVPAITVEIMAINEDKFIFRIIMPVMKNSRNKAIQDFCDNDPVINSCLGNLYFLALTKGNQISLVTQHQVKLGNLDRLLSTYLKTINWIVHRLHGRLRQAGMSKYVLDARIDLFWGETRKEAEENLRQTSDKVKIRQSMGIKISYTDELAGGGHEFGDDYLVDFVKKNIGKTGKAYEWCAGPAFIGYSLLSNGLCGSLCLSDINPKAVEISRKTASENGLMDKVTIYLSNCFNNIPDTEKWDLVVGNPPWSKNDLMIPSWGREIKYKDLNFDLHARFFRDVKKFLNPGANIILLETYLCSSADDFLPMINKAGLYLKKIVQHDKNPMIYAMWITADQK